MFEFAEFDIRLEVPLKDGRTTREHLEAAEEMSGRRIEQLHGPECPELLEYLWIYFQELSSGRQGGFGPTVISWEAIYAWSNLMNTKLSPWEVSVIKRLDGIWVRCMNNIKSAQGKSNGDHRRTRVKG